MNFAVILSGGIGTRMRTNGYPKQYIEVNKKPILVYTLEQFQKCTEVDYIVIVAAEQWKNQIIEWTRTYHISKFLDIAPPGDTRQESILHGLETCIEKSNTSTDGVIIHDAVRPLVSEQLIISCLSALNGYDGCMPVLEVKDTIYQSDSGEVISNLLKRSTLFAGQAPEAFRLQKYTKINQEASKEELENTCGTSEIAYMHNMDICLIPGEESNFKLTTPEDLERFRNIVSKGGVL